MPDLLNQNKNRPRMPLGILGLVLLLTGCALNSRLPAAPTLIPEVQLPTVIARTSQAIATQTAAAHPTATPTITPTLSPTPSLTPTPSLIPQSATTDIAIAPPSPALTPTPDPLEAIPFAMVQIIQPPHLSKVVSPIELYTYLPPGEDGRIRVELTGEDGRMLYRQVFLYPETPPGARVKLNANITFGLIGVAETGRLTVSIADAYGRLKALSSTDLVLLAEGQADLTPTGDLLEDILIQQPTAKSLIQGNSVLVSGLARTADDQPLLVELIAADGRVIGSRLAGIAPLKESGGHRLFAAEVPFSVNSPTWVRITVTDRSGRLPGLRHVSSVEVLLSP